ncbi:hypothetical protein [Sinorhizobium sp. M4_45]|uniref:hypothetical protein n=1 Tax=Sinorhizobium sp. M4_45 TaxID=2037901 RepID=UPI000C9B5A10|nr:hypothetical protein [Sinorhizobium sp. M4_45]PND27619.1 hypothetical protein CN933_05695 [Sinorhizobium sp. M4_45]
MVYFNDDDKRVIIKIVTKIYKNRDAILGAFPSNFRETFTKCDNTTAQIIADFNYLNEQDYILENGNPKCPIAIWLRTCAIFYAYQAVTESQLTAFAASAEEYFLSNSKDLYIADRELVRAKLRDLLFRLYMPFLASHLGGGNFNAEKLARGIEQAVMTQADYGKKVFINNLSRTLVVKSENSSPRFIEVCDTSKFEFVPFAAEDELVWKTKRFATGELELSNYLVTREIVKVGGLQLMSDDETDIARQVLTKTYRITSKGTLQPHPIIVERNTSWELDRDPTFEQVSPYVIDGCNLEILNQASGLRIIFREVGGVDLFRPEPHIEKWDVIPYGHSRKLSAARALLPEQGYMLIISRPL